jgi:XTP/dITP diphosphohydrolase
MELVIATHNLHKVREIREMLKNLPQLDILSLLNFPDYDLPPETGKSFEENASLKAKHASNALKKWVLADDSGLVVPSLKGQPGIHSKRYASDDATDSENRQKLLKEMENFQDLQRSAYFECCLVLAGPKGIHKTVHGTVEGTIADKEKGRNGFGYDPLFIKNDYDKTFAELDEQTKNRISHRRKALDKLLSALESLKEE